MITNGDVLKVSNIKKLFKSGLSVLLISVYDGPESLNKFKNMCEESGLKSWQYVIRNRYLPPEKDFGITISNRGGFMNDAVHSIKSLKNPLNEPCYYPSYNLFIDYNGDVLMCSHDWGKKNILGNLNNSSIKNIWLSDNARRVEGVTAAAARWTGSQRRRQEMPVFKVFFRTSSKENSVNQYASLLLVGCSNGTASFTTGDWTAP